MSNECAAVQENFRSTGHICGCATSILGQVWDPLLALTSRDIPYIVPTLQLPSVNRCYSKAPCIWCRSISPLFSVCKTFDDLSHVMLFVQSCHRILKSIAVAAIFYIQSCCHSFPLPVSVFHTVPAAADTHGACVRFAGVLNRNSMLTISTLHVPLNSTINMNHETIWNLSACACTDDNIYIYSI